MQIETRSIDVPTFITGVLNDLSKTGYLSKSACVTFVSLKDGIC